MQNRDPDRTWLELTLLLLALAVALVAHQGITPVTALKPPSSDQQITPGFPID